MAQWNRELALLGGVIVLLIAAGRTLEWLSIPGVPLWRAIGTGVGLTVAWGVARYIQVYSRRNR